MALHNLYTTMWYCAIFRPTKARSQELALGLQQRGYLCHILCSSGQTQSDGQKTSLRLEHTLPIRQDLIPFDDRAKDGRPLPCQLLAHLPSACSPTGVAGLSLDCGPAQGITTATRAALELPLVREAQSCASIPCLSYFARSTTPNPPFS